MQGSRAASDTATILAEAAIHLDNRDIEVSAV